MNPNGKALVVAEIIKWSISQYMGPNQSATLMSDFRIFLADPIPINVPLKGDMMNILKLQRPDLYQPIAEHARICTDWNKQIKGDMKLARKREIKNGSE